MPPARNLVNLKAVSKGYGSRTVLAGVTLGISEGERIGVVGRNGDGKSTLLKLIAGAEEPDAGLLVRSGDLTLDRLGQADSLAPEQTIRQELVAGRADHEWLGDPTFRSVLDGLLGGVGLTRFPDGIDTVIGPLSGGERRRIALAKLLLDAPRLLLLDEPTNHLDIEGVDWLARFLAARRGTLAVVTHDRWFLDAVCTRTWEVADGAVHQYDGGYAAYTLARAERDRQAAAVQVRRQNLLRKELAWLRRGPPARTSKPRFRIEAANALIADEPEPRDTTELLKFATARLGGKVLDVEDVTAGYGDAPPLLDHVTWRLGPGDRRALVGVNGAGKTTLISLLEGTLAPQAGRVERGSTVRLAHLSQETAELPGDVRVLDSLEAVRGRTTLADGSELTAGSMCDRFGFRGDKARTLIRDLSGGERRRLQLMRLLMDEPNVLLLDEPTNDLDIDTLQALEDLLDAWPGTLVVVSHDRWFVERVCDDVHALMGDGTLRHLPGGLDEYVDRRRTQASADGAASPPGAGRTAPTPDAGPGRAAPAAAGAGAGHPRAARSDGAAAGRVLSGGEQRTARKELARLERAVERLTAREADLHEQMAAHATDPARLAELTAELAATTEERDELETAWLEASELLEA